jgi:hypothetical protein
MSLARRFVLAAVVLAVLVALFVAGLLFSPQKRLTRAAGAPLLDLARESELTGVEIERPGAAPVSLRAREGGWEAEAGGRWLPASADRVRALAQLAAGLPRGTLVTRDPARGAELGLDPDEARLLALRFADGHEVALEVGKRAPSGEADYARVRGQDAAYLVRSSLSVLLAQETSYWYDLRVLPAGIRGRTIVRVAVRGRVDPGAPGLRGNYTLQRGNAESGDGWSLAGSSGPVDAAAAQSMVDSLALLEGEDFLEARPVPSTTGGPARGTLEVELTTVEGQGVRLSVRAGPEPGLVSVTAEKSPWTYLVREELLRRAVRSVEELRTER